MQFRAKQIAPPKDWGTFEDLCHALFKRVWNDPLSQKNGRGGQSQHGVDVFGSPDGDRRSYQGVQCKGKDANYGSTAKWAEVLEEIGKAEKFSPTVDHWIFATTAPVDGSLQRAAREISVERREKGLFTVDVLGWEEIQALMADAPEVITEFYPEHADHLSDVLEALRALPSLQTTLKGLINELLAPARAPISVAAYDTEIWEKLTFDNDRGLGPALMGYPLGPSDATACPTLPEVSSALTKLKIAYSVRLVGEPGSGKSIGAYQAAQALASEGFEVLELIDLRAKDVTLEPPSADRRRVYLIDDAHLLRPRLLDQIESQAGPYRMILSTHNTVERVNHRGTITLDAKRAVKAIAAAFRADFPRTLEAVRRADPMVGERMMNEYLDRRLDHAEETSDFPWQFCFVLGGGWHRSQQAADAARAAEADLVLAAVAIRQLISRDARATPAEIGAVCVYAGIEDSAVSQALLWLRDERLIIGESDCRTPHQRFASIVLKRILEGTDKQGRSKIAAIVEGVLSDTQFPMAGLRVLVNELRFGSGDYNWTRLLKQTGVKAAVRRCWSATGADRNFAALALADLWDFAEGGAATVVGQNVRTLATWISIPSDGAYGFGRLLNDLVQKDRSIAAQAIGGADAYAIAAAYSSATPDTAYGLANLLSSIAYIKVEAINTKILAMLDRDKLRALASHEGFEDDAYVFAKFCASVVWWDEALALDMAEAFVPIAQRLLAKDPIEGFHQLQHDFASTVLHVFDVLGIYVGELKPSRRQWAIARKLCAKVDPKRVAQQITELRPRHFQSAGFFLHFLYQVAPRKYEATLRQLDWVKIDAVIGADWANMPHDTEVLLGSLYSHRATRHLVQQFIAAHQHQIVQFPPRLMLMAPDVGIAHVAKGRPLRLAHYNHLSLEMGGLALAMLAESRPDLVQQAVAAFSGDIASTLSNYNRNFTGPAEALVRVIIEYAPRVWATVLNNIDPAKAEANLVECLRQDEDHRRTAASLIESAIAVPGPVGDMARRLRIRFPRASVPNAGAPRFGGNRHQTRRKRTN